MSAQEIRNRNKTYEAAIEQLKSIKIYAGKQLETTGEITALTYTDYLLSRHDTKDKVLELLGDNWTGYNNYNHGITYLQLKK